MHQSIPSTKIPPPPGNFFEVVKSPASEQNFPAKARPLLLGQKTPIPGEYFRRFSQPFLLIGIKIWDLQTLKRNGRLSNYSLVIPSSFSAFIQHQLSTVIIVQPPGNSDRTNPQDLGQK